jgi:hypothetical protein
MAQGTPALGCHQRRGTFPAAGAPDPSAMAHGRSGKAGSGMRAVVSQALCPPIYHRPVRAAARSGYAAYCAAGLSRNLPMRADEAR